MSSSGIPSSDHDLDQIQDLPSSKLGTKEYWDQIYETELENFHDHGDEGEIWFGRAVERRVLDWIKLNLPDSTKILDLGCGNGHFTLKLIEAGWDHVAGLDYSEKAVELAKKLLRFPLNDERIFQADILNPETLPRPFHSHFDLILDKGTFDAISLNPDFQAFEKVSKTRIISDSFKITLQTLLAEKDSSSSSSSSSSLFIITSCNWTASELIQIFGPEFEPVGEIAHTKFVFGGKSGQDVSTLIFKRK